MLTLAAALGSDWGTHPDGLNLQQEVQELLGQLDPDRELAQKTTELFRGWEQEKPVQVGVVVGAWARGVVWMMTPVY